MTKLISQKEAERNFRYCSETIKLKSFIEGRFLELGKRLYDIQERELYHPNYDTFSDFCEDLKMSPSKASKLSNIYKKFVLEYGIDPEVVANSGGWSAVSVALPLIDSKRSAVKWLNIIKNTSKRDVEKEVREVKTGITEYDCKHKKDFYVLRICRECGFREVLEDSKNEERN